MVSIYPWVTLNRTYKIYNVNVNVVQLIDFNLKKKIIQQNNHRKPFKTASPSTVKINYQTVKMHGIHKAKKLLWLRKLYHKFIQQFQKYITRRDDSYRGQPINTANGIVKTIIKRIDETQMINKLRYRGRCEPEHICEISFESKKNLFLSSLWFYECLVPLSAHIMFNLWKIPNQFYESNTRKL